LKDVNKMGCGGSNINCMNLSCGEKANGTGSPAILVVVMKRLVQGTTGSEEANRKHKRNQQTCECRLRGSSQLADCPMVLHWPESTTPLAVAQAPIAARLTAGHHCFCPAGRSKNASFVAAGATRLKFSRKNHSFRSTLTPTAAF
jgi:hypothetical protein